MWDVLSQVRPLILLCSPKKPFFVEPSPLTFTLAMITGGRYVKIIKKVDLFASGLLEYSLADASIYESFQLPAAPNQDMSYIN